MTYDPIRSFHEHYYVSYTRLKDFEVLLTSRGNSTVLRNLQIYMEIGLTN